MPSKPITMDAVYTAPGYLFRRMQQIAVAIFVEECKAFDLTPVQYAALIAIHTHPGIDATRLSAVIAFDRSTLGNVIERLEAKKLIERKPSAEDKRVKLLYLTKAGAALLRDIMASVDRAQARMLQPLKPADRKTLMALLTQLVDLNNEASRVPLRAEDALEHMGKSAVTRRAASPDRGRRHRRARHRARASRKRASARSCWKRRQRSARSAPASSSGRMPFTPSTISASARPRAAWPSISTSSG